MTTFLQSNRLSGASAAVVFVLLPLWIVFWWEQRAWASAGWILAGGPALVALAVALGALAWRRREPAGRWAAVTAALLPTAIFAWMNFLTQP